MPQVSYRVHEYLWVTVPITLEAFCNQLGNDLQLPAFDFDYENVWEWGLTKIEQWHLEVNISRKHQGGGPLLNEPIHILLLVENTAPISYDSEWVKRNLVPVYGQAVANLTNQPTYYGKVEYLRSNDFSYLPLHTFEPQT
jgi:hypothetical protein